MLPIFEIVILNTKRKDCKSRKKLLYVKLYVHEIAAVDLTKIYLLKNAKKTFKPNNRDLNRDWINMRYSAKYELIWGAFRYSSFWNSEPPYMKTVYESSNSGNLLICKLVHTSRDNK